MLRLDDPDEFHDLGNGIMNLAWFINQAEKVGLDPALIAEAREQWSRVAGACDALRRRLAAERMGPKEKP